MRKEGRVFLLSDSDKLVRYHPLSGGNPFHHSRYAHGSFQSTGLFHNGVRGANFCGLSGRILCDENDDRGRKLIVRIGPVKKIFFLEGIVSCRVTKVPWYYGFGI